MAAATLKPPVAETTTNAPPPSKLGKPYGDVVISLENCLLPEERLQATPSSLDGLDAETEMDLRILGCELIQTAGILLDLPQVAMATGQVLFQRFYYSKSFVRHAMEVTAMGCVCLASKVEESPRRIRDIISVFNHIKQMSAQKPLEPVLLDQNYINLKNQVIKAERRVLKELGFCVHVKHPHKIIVVYLQMLGSEKNRKLIQLCWNYMNDSLRTDVFVRYSPETIACACIYLSSRKLNIALPKKPAWFELFGCTEEQLKDICIRILKLYKRPKPDADQLEKVVAQLRDAYQESRVKQKLQLEGSENLANKQQFANSPSTVAGVMVAGIPTTTAEGKTLSGAISSTNSPAPVKDEKNHISSKRSRTRSRSRSHDKRKSRHHRKKRSRSRSRTRSRSRSHEKRRDRDRDRRKRDSRDRERDYKHRKDRERSRERERDRRSRKDRSLSRDRRR